MSLTLQTPVKARKVKDDEFFDILESAAALDSQTASNSVVEDTRIKHDRPVCIDATLFIINSIVFLNRKYCAGNNEAT